MIPRSPEWSEGAAGPLLQLVAPVTDWRSRAICRASDDRTFFPPKGPAAEKAVSRAKAICLTCPVMAECRDWALRHPAETEFGIWGGTTRNERLHPEQMAPAPDTRRKLCGRCHCPKPLGDFHRRRDTPDGRQAWCKECQRPWRQRRSTAA